MKNVFDNVRKTGKIVNLDFSNRDHSEAFCRLYGGTENMKEHFPLFYEAYCKAKELHEVGKGLDYRTLLQMASQDEQEAFVDGVDISCVSYSTGNNILYVEANTSLNKQALFIDEHIEIQTSAGETVYGDSQSTADSYTSCMKVETPFNPKEFKTDEVLVDYTVTWIDGDTGLLKAQMYSKSVNMKSKLTSCVSSIDLTFPKSDYENVVICYNRQPSVSEHVDRTYKQALVNDKQKLYLDVNGSVKLKNPAAAAFEQIDPSSFILKLISRGMAQYNTTDRMDEIKQRFIKTDDGFEFTLDSDWRDYVPTARLPLEDLANFSLTAEFDLSDGTKGDFTISSTAEKTEGNTYKCQQLKLLWGCLAGDTRILMENGSEKMIRDIHAGEHVCLENGDIGLVENTWTGEEYQPVICLETTKGKLCCTELHPVKTNNGIKKAGKITGADCLLDSNENELQITGIYPVYVETVYNLDVRNLKTNSSGGNILICNGILAGDNILQNICNTDANTSNGLYAEECQKKNCFFAQRGW